MSAHTPEAAGSARKFREWLRKGSVVRSSTIETLFGRTAWKVRSIKSPGLLIIGLLLACLGLSTLALPGAAFSQDPEALEGSWGGRGILLEITEAGARLEYDCAFGSVDGPLIPDSEGRFEATGTHSFEMGGPRVEGEAAPKAHLAQYEGQVTDSVMTLLTLLPELQKTLGPFELKKEERARLDKCL